MHEMHKLGLSNTDTFCYSNWQNLLKPSNSSSGGIAVAHRELSNKFWQARNITFTAKQHFLKYRTDTIHMAKHSHNLANRTVQPTAHYVVLLTAPTITCSIAITQYLSICILIIITKLSAFVAQKSARDPWAHRLFL